MKCSSPFDSLGCKQPGREALKLSRSGSDHAGSLSGHPSRRQALLLKFTLPIKITPKTLLRSSDDAKWPECCGSDR
jgi:hypothetical protein